MERGNSASAEDQFSMFRIAMCQVETAEWDINGNFQRTVSALNHAADDGADLAITPECVLHGYPNFHTSSDIERMKITAEPLNGSKISSIRDLARQRNLNVVLGFAERGADGTIYNSAAFINEQGDIVTVYRKVHCRDFEAAWGTGIYTPGNSFTVVDIHLRGHTYRLGLIICFDREIAESIRCIRAMGAELVVCPLATDTFNMCGDGTEHMINNEVLTRCRAVENEVFIVVVNHAGRFNGGSYIVDPLGRCLSRMGGRTDVVVANVPLSAAAIMHDDAYSWMGWGYRRSDVYSTYL